MAKKEDVLSCDHSGTIPPAGYSQNDTSPKSLENPPQQASVSRSLSAGLANAKPAANTGLSLSTTRISAAPGGIHSQVPVYKNFHLHVPSLYMPRLDDHIEGQRVYHNEFQRTYFKTSILQTLTTSVHISFAATSWRKLRTKWDPSRHKHRRIRSRKRHKGKSHHRMVDLGPIGIYLFNHYSTVCYKGF